MTAAPRTEESPRELPLDALVPSQENPRRTVNDAGMAGLIESIAANGIIQPLVVRPLEGPVDGPTRYEIIAGHRRHAAARAAGLAVVPVRVIAGVTAGQIHTMRVVENLQRAGLDPVEQAEALERLRTQEGLTDAAVGALIGKSGGWVCRTRLLLALPNVVQDALRARRLTSAQGWALQRYRAFPALAERLALIAQRDGIGSAALDIPFVAAGELARSGLVQSLADTPPGFDMSVCAACPFKARFTASSADPGYCAKPAHYRQLVAEARRRLTANGQAVGGVAPTAWPLAPHRQRIPAGTALVKALASVDRLLERLTPTEAASLDLVLLVRQHRGVLDRVIPATCARDDLMDEEESA